MSDTIVQSTGAALVGLMLRRQEQRQGIDVMQQLLNSCCMRGEFAVARKSFRPRIAACLHAAFVALSFDALAVHCLTVHAQDLASSPVLLGDRDGARSRLNEKGVAFDLGYGSQLAHNVDGGTRELTRYTDQWVLGTTVDLERLGGWRGGTFQATLTDRNGRDLGADAHIGNSMLVQEVYGRSQTWHLTQFWLDQRLLEGAVDVKLGRLTVGEDFASFPCDFQNLTFCGSQPGNIVGNYWVNWPTSQWAARVKVQAPMQVYLQAGLYQVNPRYLEDDYARHNGWTLDNPGGTTGGLIPVEVGWLPDVDGRPGSYKVGAWYDTSDAPDLYEDIHHDPRGLSGLSPLVRKGRYGAYLSFQQQVAGIPDGRGVSLFLNAAQADRATAALDRQIAAGATWRGPFTRVEDAIGFAVGLTHSNPRLARFDQQQAAHTGQREVAGSGNEFVTELYYSWVPIRSVVVRPNLQYIVHPGGTSANRDAFVVGLKSGVSF